MSKTGVLGNSFPAPPIVFNVMNMSIIDVYDFLTIEDTVGSFSDIFFFSFRLNVRSGDRRQRYPLSGLARS